MKAELKETTYDSFKPLHIELIIESEEELINLWARCNINAVVVRKENKAFLGSNYSEGFDSDGPLFHLLDDEMINRALPR